MSNVKIAPELDIQQVAFAMTLLCGRSDADTSYLRDLTYRLSKYSHDHIFEQCYKIAQANGRQLFGRDASFKEFMADYDGRDALFLSLPGDTPVIGAMVAGNIRAPSESLSPDQHQDQKLMILTALGIARPEPTE
jgi:hypothetical protein